MVVDMAPNRLRSLPHICDRFSYLEYKDGNDSDVKAERVRFSRVEISDKGGERDREDQLQLPPRSNVNEGGPHVTERIPGIQTMVVPRAAPQLDCEGSE